MTDLLPHHARPTVLEALLRLEERDQVPAPTTVVRAVLAVPLYVRTCAVLEALVLEGQATFLAPEPGVWGGWSLTEAGRALARATRRT